MRRYLRKALACGATLLFSGLLSIPQASAQKVTAVPKLDLTRYMGVWYEIARLPIKAEKTCTSDVTVLYALNDKKNTFQRGTFCVIASGAASDWGSTGKMDKQGSGKLKISRWVVLSTKYWVLATGPNYEWALVGSPNHKTLWVLSRTATLPAETYQQIVAQASAQGFKTAKLLTVTHHPGRSAISASGVAPPKVTPAAAENPK